MKKNTVLWSAVILSMFLAHGWVRVEAQTKDDSDEVVFKKRNLSGPRIGLTYIPGDRDIAKLLRHKDLGRWISQFGWHFEYQVMPRGGGPQFVVQFVPLVAGVEYGKVIPSATLAMGIRMPDGIEFGLGPNVLIADENTISTALVIAVGKTFNYGGVSIPINLVYATSPAGARLGFIFGYAIKRSSR